MRSNRPLFPLAAASVTGCQAHQLLIASQRLPIEVFRDNRGWNEQQWNDAEHELQERGLIHDRALTSIGRRVHDEIESLTDSLAYGPLAKSLSESEVSGLIDALTATAVEIASSGVMAFPNPMGLPAIATS